MKTIKDNDNPVVRHISGDDLIAYLDGELPRPARDATCSHLESCWNCRSRLHAVQESIENFLQLQRKISINELPSAGNALEQFRLRLHQHKSNPAQNSPQPSKLKQWFSSWQSLFPVNPLAIKYGKATLPVLLCLVLLIILPYLFNQQLVSASELLDKADKYEQTYHSNEKVVRSTVRVKRINLSNKTEKNIGQIETLKDNLSPAVRSLVSVDSGKSYIATVPDKQQLREEIPLKTEFSEPLTRYFEAQKWYPEVSAAAYRKLIADRGEERTSVEESTNEYTIEHFFAPEHYSSIVKTSISLNTTDYSPKRISIFTFEDGNSFEYRFTRTDLEFIPRTPEIAKLFSSEKIVKSNSAPDEEVPKEKIEPLEPKAETKTKVTKTEAALPNRTASKAASFDLEIEVMRLLSQADADTGEQISVNRTKDGILRVEGIVETAGRKSEVLDALNSVSNNPAVEIKIQTVEEAVAEQQQQKSKLRAANSQKIEVSGNSFAAEPELRLYFGRQGKNAETEIQAFAARMVNRSGRAMSHAAALKRIAKQFSLEEIRKLSPEARSKWLSLIRRHAHEFEQENETLRQELQPIFSVPAAAASITIKNDEDLLQAVDRLFEYGTTNDQVIRSAFSVTTNGAAVSAIKSRQFWSSLKSAGAIADAIEKTQ